MNRTYSLIVAYSFSDRIIGQGGAIPWHISEDLAHFKRITSSVESNNAIIMGRRTWESIGCKPLPNRLNIVITRSTITSAGEAVHFCTWETLETCLAAHNVEQCFIIGGQQIYELALKSCTIDKIYATEVYLPKGYISNENLVKFPNTDEYGFKLSVVSDFKISASTTSVPLYYRFMEFEKTDTPRWRNISEVAYLELMARILKEPVRCDRTGVGTHSMFGEHLVYELGDTFPIATTKRMFFRGIFEELMMYLRGCTDNKILQAKNIHVWDGNTTREFLDNRGLQHYEIGDMGSTYGFNFRHFGANYKGCGDNYDGQGFDQLEEVIKLLKTDPNSRRIIINLWNPAANAGAALPACLCMYQFYVRDGKYLDLQIYIRSSDYFLANNWNTCTGAMLVHLLCSLEGLEILCPGRLIVCSGDTHIYQSHDEQVKINLGREPHPYPKLVIKARRARLEDFVFDDLELIGYKSYPSIPAPMAV